MEHGILPFRLSVRQGGSHARLCIVSKGPETLTDLSRSLPLHLYAIILSGSIA
jgi:hypothetical protein